MGLFWTQKSSDQTLIKNEKIGILSLVLLTVNRDNHVYSIFRFKSANVFALSFHVLMFCFAVSIVASMT